VINAQGGPGVTSDCLIFDIRDSGGSAVAMDREGGGSGTIVAFSGGATAAAAQVERSRRMAGVLDAW
jgi:microcompartment protein CcmK/EutM